MFVNTPEQLAEKKLLLLYILDQAEGSLTNSQITQFILENDIMNYFMLQQFLSELKEADFIAEEEKNHSQLFSITHKGKNTLNYFVNRIPKNQKEEINTFIHMQKENLQANIEIRGDYHQLGEEKKYVIRLTMTEDNTPVIDLKLNLSEEEEAKNICINWKRNPKALYNEIIKLLSL
ncbi:DUF4364 family protein [Clostridium formicaceticum]|uniref:DUF4364 domain-containing protein n=1 Tax=Clostridium formicaceticum TaxID=1497 RepID=A0AAC9RJ85_9CLOT|nr:DUF4364 family protein [Clostridium formicaceticum]AOY76210.1 hypothetical protein BJL90_10040 [Clostridium formicaceticum]ARE86589.1 hypothetical protein CLFO_09130 [Clostridium formicaceticum]